MSDCHTSKLVTARKDHRCECSRHRRGEDGEIISRPCFIAKGEIHNVSSGIFDGYPFRSRLCLFHDAVCCAIHKSNRCGWGEEIDLDELNYYTECNSFKEWVWWLSAIRIEYRKLKAQSAERKT